MLRVVDMANAPALDVSPPAGLIMAYGSAPDEYWLNTATFTLSEEPNADRRVITVDSVPQTLAELTRRCQRWPHASAVCDDVLRAVDPAGATLRGVITESLAYSTLQAGPEFARWLEERGPARVPDIADPVTVERDGDVLRIRFNRPQRHNAFSTEARAALLEALSVAVLDPSVTAMVLSGNGPS
ncbi:enoyl-CoA hydratase-related protein, partial [Mycobacterium kubicae]|uniref:enoyl-CoA hydratase-related protein n=1 Tax=Mycobacterium kubicae TaxID=120959 RepID=UPI001F621C09